VNRYRRIIRWVFTVVFTIGAAVHIIFAFCSPGSYAAYGTTAPPWLAQLWSSFVMPNIWWLALLMALVEARIAAGLASHGRRVQVAAAASLCFFAFLLLLGYSWPTASPLEDFFKNRATTLVLAAAVAPLLFDADAKTLLKRWPLTGKPAHPSHD
jgi:hypothetical protein